MSNHTEQRPGDGLEGTRTQAMSVHTDRQSFCGQLIAHYRVARHLGSVEMGELFLAEDTRILGSHFMRVWGQVKPRAPGTTQRP